MSELFAKRTGNSLMVVLSVDDPDKPDHPKQTSFFCHDIKGSLVWPTANSPAYYCIIGQSKNINRKGKLPLIFLGERARELPKDIFKLLKKDSRRLACFEFFNDLLKENRDLITLFYDFCRYQRINNISLTKAPLVGKFHLGARLLNEWINDNALQIPKGTILYKQLKQMQVPHAEVKPEEKFFAVNALQFIIASVERQPWRGVGVGVMDQQAYIRSRERADPVGWT